MVDSLYSGFTRRVVSILRADNRIVIHPTTPALWKLLRPELTFVFKEWLQGREATLAEKFGKPPFIEMPIDCYFLDHKNRITTTHGFIDRISRVLQSSGFVVEQKWVDPGEELAIAARRDVFDPDWDTLYNYLETLNMDLRLQQDQALMQMALHDCGRIDCPPAWGKTFLIRCACLTFRNARFLITSRRVKLLTKEIYPELCRTVSDVGCIGGGLHKNPGARVVVCSAQSLQHVRDFEYDFILFDECHESPTDDCAYKLGLLPGRPRMWGFSGTHDMRFDNRDLIVESIFGPVRVVVKREEAQQAGIVAPIRVKVRNVNMNVNPCLDCRRVDKKRLAYWTNTHRNRLIAEDARGYPNKQVLVVVETIEHLVHIKHQLPEMVMMHAEGGMKPHDRARYVAKGLLRADEPQMTWNRVDRIYQAICQGRPGIYGALEQMVGVGFNAPKLTVVVRGDGASSPTRDRQLPGRAGREDEEKEEGIVHDYMDNFDVGCQRKSKMRIASYKAEKFTIEVLDGNSRLEKALGG